MSWIWTGGTKMEEIRLVFFLPMLFLMMTSGLPAGDFDIGVSKTTTTTTTTTEERYNESGTQHDWTTEISVPTTGAARVELTFGNESLELSPEATKANDEKEHFNSTTTSTTTPKEVEEQSSASTSISNRSTMRMSSSIRTTSQNEDGGVDHTVAYTTTTMTTSSTKKPDEMLPFHAPLHQNYTKVPLRGSCNNSTHQCVGDFVECQRGTCQCREGYGLRYDDRNLCGERVEYNMELPQTDPTMIGVIVGLILMSVTLCIVLRLFAKARFRENRTIFNTPNPRLMNVSLMKGSKQLFRGNSGGNANRSRRGSQVSLQSTSDVPARSPSFPNTEDDDPGKFESPAPAQNSRPKVSRTMSTDVAGSSGGGITPLTESVRPSSGGVNGKRYKYRQDSVQSNV